MRSLLGTTLVLSAFLALSLGVEAGKDKEESSCTGTPAASCSSYQARQRCTVAPFADVDTCESWMDICESMGCTRVGCECFQEVGPCDGPAGVVSCTNFITCIGTPSLCTDLSKEDCILVQGCSLPSDPDNDGEETDTESPTEENNEETGIPENPNENPDEESSSSQDFFDRIEEEYQSPFSAGVTRTGSLRTFTAGIVAWRIVESALW